MPDVAEIARSSSAEKRSVQHYIDERPIWPDGTILPSVPMTAMQWRIWTLAAAGKFFEGFVVFMTGVALPLISREFGIGSAQNGLISAASLLGHPDRRHRPRRHVGHVRPQADVHHRDDHLLRLPGAAGLLHQFHFPDHLPASASASRSAATIPRRT